MASGAAGGKPRRLALHLPLSRLRERVGVRGRSRLAGEERLSRLLAQPLTPQPTTSLREFA
jgi:hypothetical protein